MKKKEVTVKALHHLQLLSGSSKGEDQHRLILIKLLKIKNLWPLLGPLQPLQVQKYNILSRNNG